MKNIQGDVSTLKKWHRADNYMGTDFSEYYAGLCQTRDSCLIEQSNFASALERLGGESHSVIVARSNHWAVGWVEQILVHPRAKAKVRELAKIKAALEAYPVLDDDDYYTREAEYTAETFEQYREDFARNLCKALKLETLEGMFPKRHIEQFLRDVYQEDTGYRGSEDAYVTEESILRYVKSYEFKQESKNRVAIYIKRHA
jgi:hypothetical protein